MYTHRWHLPALPTPRQHRRSASAAAKGLRGGSSALVVVSLGNVQWSLSGASVNGSKTSTRMVYGEGFQLVFDVMWVCLNMMSNPIHDDWNVRQMIKHQIVG